jgi:citrate lyase beta subunit
MPGDDWRKIKKATTLGVDSVCMDLEDGVAQNRKNEAREVIPEALRTVDFGGAERLVRINAVGSGLEEVDLTAVLPVRPDGLVVPKVNTADEVVWVSEQIAAVERARDWPEGGIRLLALVETARGVVNLAAIARSTPRLAALIFGAEDLAGDIGAIRTPAGWEVFYARSAVVTHAAAFGLQAIDMLNVDFRDVSTLQAEARQGMEMGFSGKQIIHPNQVEPVLAAFTPTAEEVAAAQQIVTAHEAHQAAGTGAFALEGKLVDMPVVRAAERVLVRARAAGKIS